MSMQTLERAILAELKTIAKNPKLKMKDILEWSTGDVKAEEGEVVIRLPKISVYCAIKKGLDLRAGKKA